MPTERSFGPIPIKEGHVYRVVIEGIGEKGDGIAKVRGFVIVVPGTEKNKVYNVEITAIRGRVSFGKIVDEQIEAEVIE